MEVHARKNTIAFSVEESSDNRVYSASRPPPSRGDRRKKGTWSSSAHFETPSCLDRILTPTPWHDSLKLEPLNSIMLWARWSTTWTRFHERMECIGLSTPTEWKETVRWLKRISRRRKPTSTKERSHARKAECKLENLRQHQAQVPKSVVIFFLV